MLRCFAQFDSVIKRRVSVFFFYLLKTLNVQKVFTSCRLKGTALALAICFFFHEGFRCILWLRRATYTCVFPALLLDHLEDSFWLVPENTFSSFDFPLNKNPICTRNNARAIPPERTRCHVWRYYRSFPRVISKPLVISVIRYYPIIWVSFLLNWWTPK